jgi:hypothetical protein
MIDVFCYVLALVNPNFSTTFFNNLLAYIKTEPCTIWVKVSTTFDHIKRLKQLRNFLLFDTTALISHFYSDKSIWVLLMMHVTFNHYICSVSEFISIGYEVKQYLLKSLSVDMQHLRH